MKIRAETNEKEMKETKAKINKTKSCFYEKINKNQQTISQSPRKKRDKTQINKVRNEEGKVTTDNRNTNDHKRIL